MKDFNQVFIQGKIARTPEWGTDASGTSCVSFSLECRKEQRAIDTGNGKMLLPKLKTFVDCLAYGRIAEAIIRELPKKLVVRGFLQQERWVDETGKNRSSVRVVVEEYTDNKE